MWNTNLFAILTFLATCHSKPSEIIGEITLPEECNGLRYCTVKPKGYELYEERMNNIMKQFLKTNITMKLKRSIPDEVHQPTGAEPTVSESITKSILSPESDRHNCPYETKRMPIYAVNYFNEDKVDTAVFVQTSENRQIFDIVTCAYKDVPDSETQCFQNLNLEIFGMKSTCETIYAKRSVFVYKAEQEKIGVKHFMFPVGCHCKMPYKPQ